MQTTRGEEPNLDYSWIEAGARRWRSGFSNVVCFETNDPMRHQQVVAFVAGTLEFSDVYVYDRWTGLGRLDRQRGRIEPVSAGEAGRYRVSPGSDEANVVELIQTLRRMDGVLKAGRAAFILRNPEGTGGLERSFSQEAEVLNHAVRSWSSDPVLESRKSLVVIMSSDVAGTLDPYTGSLVALTHPPIASDAERRRMIREKSGTVGIALGAAEESLVLATTGLNLHQMESVLVEAHGLTGRFDRETIRDLKADLIRRSELLDIVEPAGGFDDVGGYEAVKSFVRKYVVNILQSPATATALALPLPRGILLFGPPGTGKTLFAKALARETSLPFINFRTENLFSKWLGDSGRRFRDAIGVAEQMAPAIVFIDEIDRFGRRTDLAGDGASAESHRVFSQVLEWLGDQRRRSIVVGTTNRPDVLDDAFVRTGRFDYKIPFLYPGREAREQILRIHLGLDGGKARPEMESNVLQAITAVVETTKGFTGSELEEMVTRAKRNALSDVRTRLVGDDLLRAARGFRVDAGGREDMRMRYLDMARKFTDDRDFLEQMEEED